MTSHFKNLLEGIVLRRFAVPFLFLSISTVVAQKPPASAAPAQVAVPISTTAPAPTPPKNVPTGPPTVAILPFIGDEMELKRLSAVTKRFQAELSATDSFRIVDRRKIDKVLLEPRYQEGGACDKGGCSVEIGKLLGVQGIVTGVVSRGNESWRLEVKIVEVETGRTTFSHLIEIYGSYNDLLHKGCPTMALIVSGLVTPETNYTALEGGGIGSIWPWLAGGLAVAGGATVGVLLLTHGGGSSGSPATNTTDQLIVKW